MSRGYFFLNFIFLFCSFFFSKSEGFQLKDCQRFEIMGLWFYLVSCCQFFKQLVRSRKSQTEAIVQYIFVVAPALMEALGPGHLLTPPP